MEAAGYLAREALSTWATCVRFVSRPMPTQLADTRGSVLWNLDAASKLRYSHENPDVLALYEQYLEKPLGHRSHHLLHTDLTEWEMPLNPDLK